MIHRNFQNSGIIASEFSLKTNGWHFPSFPSNPTRSVSLTTAGWMRSWPCWNETHTLRVRLLCVCGWCVKTDLIVAHADRNPQCYQFLKTSFSCWVWSENVPLLPWKSSVQLWQWFSEITNKSVNLDDKTFFHCVRKNVEIISPVQIGLVVQQVNLFLTDVVWFLIISKKRLVMLYFRKNYRDDFHNSFSWILSWACVKF